MKTKIPLGCLDIDFEVDGNDYQELVRQAWKIARLNSVVVQEGENFREWMPYAEINPSDGNEYAGFYSLKDGRRIRYGKKKPGNGGDWYPRDKNNSNYIGIEPAFEGAPTERQLPPASSTPSNEWRSQPNQRRQRTSSRDNAGRHSSANVQQKNAIKKIVARLLNINPEVLDDATISAELMDNGFSGIGSLSFDEAKDAIKTLNQMMNA